MAIYNERKLRRMLNERRGKHAEYLALSEEIRSIRSGITEYERRIKEADRETEYAINTENFRARGENRKPENIRLFVDLALDEMMEAFSKGHPIKNKLPKSAVESYVALRKELEDLTASQAQIGERVQALSRLAQDCKNFLEQNGIGNHGISI